MFGYTPAAVLLLALSILTEASSDQTCYYRQNDQIRVKHDWFACKNTAASGSADSVCCRNGDLCGPDELCRSPDVQEGNEFYLGGCTNKEYKGTVCNKACSSYVQSWAVYNNTGKGYWACCGHYDCADGPPTTKMFDGVSPSDWTEISQGGSSSSGLSKAAIIGIAVGVGVLGLAIIGGIVGFCLRKRRGGGGRSKALPTFGKKRQYEQLGPQDNISMQAPFVPAENQPYSRPHSPDNSQLAPSYSDRRLSGSRPSSPLHQPPRD